MNKIKLSVFLLILSIFCFSQEKKPICYNCEIQSDYIFDYFRGIKDSEVIYIGSRMIVEYDNDLFNQKNKYTLKIGDSLKGNIDIYFNNKILYSYPLKNGKINGIGYIYYLRSSHIAIQGHFKNNLLDGLVIVQDEKGEVLRIMKYKKGKYVKHIYSYLTNKKKSLKQMSKNRSDNPLLGNEVIVR